MARAIKKIVNKTTYTYACVYCSKEYDTERDAEHCEEQHVIANYKKVGDFIWLNNEEDAKLYAQATGAWGDSIPTTPGWYFPDVYQTFEDEPPHVRFLTPEQRRKELDEEIAKLSKLWAETVEIENKKP